MSNNPKVFISHASEDKARFVLKFSERLRESGVDAWLDKWETVPGDSLVDKVFDEGLKEASAIIIVLSKVSITKPWVKEELNAGFIKKIEKGCKLIPIVLDDCEVPEVLKSTVWEAIHDLNSYEESFSRIVASIMGARVKPKLGDAPYYVQESVVAIPELTKIDNLVLKLSCEYALSQGHLHIEPENIFIDENDEFIIPEQELSDSLDILNRKGLISPHKTTGVRIYLYSVSLFGFDQYVGAYVTEYDRVQEQVLHFLAHCQSTDNQKILEEISGNSLVIDHFLKVLESKEYISLSPEARGVKEFFYIHNISPEIRRMLESSN